MTSDEKDEIESAIKFYENENRDWREVVLFIILKQTDTVEDYIRCAKTPTRSWNRHRNVGRPRGKAA